MFVRNVFSPAEQAEIDQWRQRGKALCGWMDDHPTDLEPYPIYNWTADRSLIVHDATILDYKNPLHRDEEYAKRTRWGGLIAAPYFAFSIAGGMSFNLLFFPPDVATCVAVQMGEGFEEITTPIRPGDSFKIWTEEGTLTDMTPDGEQEERVLQTKDRFRIYNQRDELICVFTRTLIYLYGAPGLEATDVLRIEAKNFTPKDIRFTEEKVYTKEEIDAIRAFYFAEQRQGKKIRYWEDVNVGDEVFPIELGPITPWETCMTMASFGCVPAPVWEIEKNTPTRIFVDPTTNIPHKNIEFHLSKDFAPKIGIPTFYSSTLIQNSIFGFFGRLAENWIGDDGMIRAFDWMKFTNTPFGDTVFGYGKVVRKYIDEKGRCMVDLDLWMHNVRGFVSNSGFTSVELLSESRMNRGEEPVCENLPRAEENIAGFQVGDRVRVKPFKNWPLPTPYPTEGAAATIIEFHPSKDLTAYCFIQFDEDITGLDPRVAVGMRLDQLEKI